MVKSKPNNRAKGARRGRRTTPKNVQMKNQNSSKLRAAPMRQGVALGKTSKTRATRMYQDGDAFVVEHDEYIQDVFIDSANTFAYEVLSLNPGDGSTFPWLANIANRYEEFEAVELTPHFETAAPTTASGKVLLAIDFDPGDATDLGTKQELLNDDRTKSAPVWQSFSQTVDRGKLRKRLFVRNVDDSADPALTSALSRQQDIGNLFVATTASSLGAGAMVGELWIRYCIRFYTPVLHTPTAQASVSRINTQWPTSSATTDLLQGISIVADNSDVAVLASGIAIGTVDVTQGQLPGGSWVFANSGAAVPTGTTIIKFLRDWAGVIEFDAHQGIGTTPLPNIGSVAGAAVCQFGRLPASTGAGPSFTNDIEFDIFSSNVGITFSPFTGFNRMVATVSAMAGMGLALTVPSFSATSATIRDLFIYPTPVSLAAFRASQRRKKLGIEIQPHVSQRALNKARALPAAPSSSSSTSSTSSTSGGKL